MLNAHAITTRPSVPETVCPYELSSIRSLTAYVAQDSRRLREAEVEMMLAAYFNVGRVDQLRREDFQYAVGFLLDLHTGTRRSRR